jgi:hypothetical protein
LASIFSGPSRSDSPMLSWVTIFLWIRTWCKWDRPFQNSNFPELVNIYFVYITIS